MGHADAARLALLRADRRPRRRRRRADRVPRDRAVPRVHRRVASRAHALVCSVVETLLLARHGESEYSARGAVNGDPRIACPLTDTGREQARALGRALAGDRVDLCVVTEFERVRETADLALAGRDV